MVNKRAFLITVDTEGDDLWHWRPNRPVTTENAAQIPKFQALCEQYGFKPVYFTDYEMALEDRFATFAKQKVQEGKCEIGLHLHGWNTPPAYPLTDRFGGDPYVTEYPMDVVEAKVATMMQLLKERFETEVTAHRSGRWATSAEYFDILAGFGIRVDCSVTPELDLSTIPGSTRNCGNDYRKAEKGVHMIHPKILEVPMTTRRIRHARYGSWKHRLRTLLLGDDLWLRPISHSLDQLKFLTERVEKEPGNEYLEFMIHSSELLPGGSIFFKDAEAVEKLYEVMEQYFAWLAFRGYQGMTMQEFVRSRKEDGK